MREYFAGFATFFAMAYIAFLNPSILNGMGMPSGAVFLATCVVAALASAVSGWKLGIPAALACGMGLNVFTASFAELNHIPWPDLLVVTGIVSIAIFLASLGPWRRNLIASVPDQIFYAIKAGVGAILTTVAVTQIDSFASHGGGIGHPPGRVWAFSLFFIGLAVIVGLKLAYMYSQDSTVGPRWLKTLELLDSAAFTISIVTVMAIVWIWVWHGHAPIMSSPEKAIFWSWNGPGVLAQIHLSTLESCIGFGIAVLFIITLDIAGSPIEYVRQPEIAQSMTDERIASIKDQSLKIDSFFNIVASLAGVTPITYYAENHAGWKAGGRSGRAMVVVTIGFALLAVFGFVSLLEGWPIVEAIPRIAAMPTVFFVGLLVVAESFVMPAPPATAGASGSRSGSSSDLTPALTFIPAATTVVLASVTLSLDVAIAAGILSYVVIQTFPKKVVPNKAEWSRELGFVLAGAGLVLLLNFGNAVQRRAAAPACSPAPSTPAAPGAPPRQ